MHAVFDSDILIDVLRGIPAARNVLRQFLTKDIGCSAVTVAELWAGTNPLTQAVVENLLGGFRIIPMDGIVARQTAEYLKRYAKRYGVLLPDAAIAASAHVNKCPLLTRNLKHFPMDDIQVVKPY